MCMRQAGARAETDSALGSSSLRFRRTDMHRELKPVIEMETGTFFWDVLALVPRDCCITPEARATGGVKTRVIDSRNGAK